MPMSRHRITGRRGCDNKISESYGGQGAGTHSASAERPGTISDDLRAEFEDQGYGLCTSLPARGLGSQPQRPMPERFDQRSATKALRQEVDLIAAAKDKALEELRRLRDKVGGRNKPAKLIGVSRPYLGRVLRGEKPMTEELVQKVVQLRRDKIAMPTDLRWRP